LGFATKPAFSLIIRQPREYQYQKREYPNRKKELYESRKGYSKGWGK
jgi:hypothetical protein